MTRADSYAHVVFNDIDLGLERETPAPGAFNCTFEITLSEIIFCGCTYGRRFPIPGVGSPRQSTRLGV